MNTPTIRTNNNNRQFKMHHDVPQSVLDWYDWLDNDAKWDGWICYYGHWSHVSDYMATRNPVHMPGAPDWLTAWDGYKADGFTSGVLIRVSDDCEEYQIATYMG